MRHSKSFYTYLALTILWMGVIFWFSSHTADVSKGESGRILNIIKQVFLSITGSDLSETVINILHTLVRKAGHLFIYMVLGIFTASTVISYLRRQERVIQASLKPFIFSLVICILYAVTDEVHQLYVPGRGCRAYDVLIDTIGALIGISSIFQFRCSNGSFSDKR